jgi:AAA domain
MPSFHVFPPMIQVVLREHFRCAEEIIQFSNQHFYDDNLLPLRLPTKSERLRPSLVDVRVDDGVKLGKVNEVEALTIVRLIQDLVADTSQCRSIGVISLMGEEQSRLIRGRLLGAVGPEIMARHSILVGDPPMFQGAERDIVFLSMVCSRGNVPAQNQLMHFQRANVALSRARDRCVLVRSIDAADVSSFDDIKIPIIAFFTKHNDEIYSKDSNKAQSNAISTLLKTLLLNRGYAVREMGEVWRDALCVEDCKGDARAALKIECQPYESREEWLSSFLQQKAIERVGWKCMRIDAMTLAVDPQNATSLIEAFLVTAGVESIPFATSYESVKDADSSTQRTSDRSEHVRHLNAAPTETPRCSPQFSERNVNDFNTNMASGRSMDASEFGQLVNLDFLVQGNTGRNSRGSDSEHSIAADSCSSRCAVSETEGVHHRTKFPRLGDDSPSIGEGRDEEGP